MMVVASVMLVKELEVADAEAVTEVAGQKIEAAAHVGHIVDVQIGREVVAAAEAADVLVIEVSAADEGMGAMQKVEIKAAEQVQLLVGRAIGATEVAKRRSAEADRRC